MLDGFCFFMACQMVKIVDLSQIVFVWSTNEAFTRMDTHIHTHTHTYTHTHTHKPFTHTLMDKKKFAIMHRLKHLLTYLGDCYTPPNLLTPLDMSWRLFFILDRTSWHPLTHLGDYYTPPNLLTPLDIDEIGIVRSIPLSRVLQTLRFWSMYLPMYSIRIFNFENQSQGRWGFWWKLADDGILSTCNCM